jgi:protein-L-isoaspartate(D-aspartate) O-methyltransferase
MSDEARTSQARRDAMVETQLRGRGIADERVLDAMARIPREAFLPEHRRDLAYVDGAVPIEAGQTISQPYMVARMTELLKPVPGMRVLEIGTGSGYQSAVLAELGGRILSIERQPDLAAHARTLLGALGHEDSVEVRVGDGSLGAPEDAPFDGIIVTAGAPSIPVELRDQLADGARLVVPVGPRDRQDLRVVERHGNDWLEWSEGPCVFVPLVGRGGWPG